MSSSSLPPPQYVLVQQSSSVLFHPDIEYRYADDPPSSLLPRHPDEHVLVLYHSPDTPTNPTIKSTSSQLAVSDIKVLPAPGAGAEEDNAPKNPNMYVLQVTTASDDQYATSLPSLSAGVHSTHHRAGLETSQTFIQNPLAVVSRFKERWARLGLCCDGVAQSLLGTLPSDVSSSIHEQKTTRPNYGHRRLAPLPDFRWWADGGGVEGLVSSARSVVSLARAINVGDEHREM